MGGEQVSGPVSRSRPIEAVATSIAAFVGPAPEGPVRQVRSVAEYEQAYESAGEVADAVRLFFAGGGREAWIAGELRALDAVQDLDLIALPGETDIEVLRSALAYAGERRAFLLVDPPDDDPGRSAALVRDLRATGIPDAAVYFPRLVVDASGRTAPPSGAVAAIYVRTDLLDGVWEAPAGSAAVVSGALEPEVALGTAAAAELNDAHVNSIRSFSGRGIVVWGSRTIAEPASEWKYVPVRRLGLHLERSLDRGLEWAAFEPNDELLWAQVRMRVGEFLHGLFRVGAFAGRAPDEAFFVKCDADTMTQDDLDGGRLVMLVGFAPLKPAEFVVLRIGMQLTAS